MIKLCPFLAIVISYNFAYQYVLPILPVFYLLDYSAKSLNKKSYVEHKSLVLNVAFFVKGFG